jgi:hypothetical protein
MRSLVMFGLVRKALLLGGVVLVATATYAAAAPAPDQQTPKGWSYEIRDGKRVPKGTASAFPRATAPNSREAAGARRSARGTASP